MSIETDQKQLEGKQSRGRTALHIALTNLRRSQKACDKAQERFTAANRALAEFEAECDGAKGEKDE